MNAAHNVIVTRHVIRKIKEFSSHGDLLRDLTFSDEVTHPLHAIQTCSGQFIVSHGDRDDPVHRVCMMSALFMLSTHTVDSQVQTLVCTTGLVTWQLMIMSLCLLLKLATVE